MGPSCYIEYRGIRNRTIRGFYCILKYSGANFAGPCGVIHAVCVKNYMAVVLTCPSLVKK